MVDVEERSLLDARVGSDLSHPAGIGAVKRNQQVEAALGPVGYLVEARQKVEAKG
jgi:hypothetical protein